MLKSPEIKALSSKMNWDIRETKRCLDDIYSPNKAVIDGKIVREEFVDQFLKIICLAKNCEQRNKLIYGQFLKNFQTNLPNTIVYFLHDYFFATIMEYLDVKENRGLNGYLTYESGYGNSFNQHFGYEELEADMQTEYGQSLFMHDDFFPAEDRRADIIENLINIFYDNYKRSRKSKKHLLRLFDDRELFCINLCHELIEIVGFEVFNIESLRKVIIKCEKEGQYDVLAQFSNELNESRKQKTREKYFLFALCEILKKNKIGTRKTFRRVGKHLFKEATSIHRRYYEIKNQLEDKDYSIEEIVNIYHLGSRLENAVDKIMSKYPSE